MQSKMQLYIFKISYYVAHLNWLWFYYLGIPAVLRWRPGFVQQAYKEQYMAEILYDDVFSSLCEGRREYK